MADAPPPGTALLRPVTAADADELCEVYTANREFLRPFEPERDESFFTVIGQRERLAGVEATRAAGGGEGWAITWDSAIIGMITLSGIVRGFFQSANLGYWVSGRHNGRGHATRAVALALARAFGQLGLHRVQAATLLDNGASQRVLDRNGFTRIGVAPRYLSINGRWQDHVLFQTLSS